MSQSLKRRKYGKTKKEDKKRRFEVLVQMNAISTLYSFDIKDFAW